MNVSGDGPAATRSCRRSLPIRLLLVLLVMWPAWVASVANAANALKDHPSPYLALHGEDPVTWRDWGEAALAEARESGKPLFVSSGYFACHWCHVMQRESYRDAGIAELLNNNFIPVKVDRELNPALDDHLIRFVERTRGAAGWPLNVFLTPDGYPLIGMTYLPPAAFSEVLTRVANQWKVQADTFTALAHRLVDEHKTDPAASPSMPEPSREAIAVAVRQGALALADDLGGGFGHQNKFPMEPQLLALLAVQESHGDEHLAEFLKLTLDQMASRGLRDHLAGGFFRYTLDPDWRTPHYEKMLYNQALLARVYLAGARILNEPAYNEVARDTLDFVIRTMAGTDGGYIASLSAVDQKGTEGGAYLWDRATLERLLTADALKLALAYWSLEPAASPAEGLLPQRLRSEKEVAAELEVDESTLALSVAAVRQKLLAERAQRLPPRDTKQLAAWNGLLLSALVEGAQALKADRYRAAAASLAGFLRSLWDGERMLRARDGIRVLGEASLEDYAYVAAGLEAWARYSEDAQYLAIAREVTTAAWRQYFDDTGWSLSAASSLPGMGREPVLADGALPSPSAVLMQVTRRLWPANEASNALGLALARARVLSVGSVVDEAFWHCSHAMVLHDMADGSEN